MSGYVIWVEFRVKAGQEDDFLSAVRENAKASVRQEPGCRRFDVMRGRQGDTDLVMLYEIYDSEAAFEAHKRTRHFESFDAETRNMVAFKKARIFDLTHET